MEDPSPMEVVVLAAITVTLTLVPLFFIMRMIRKRWRQAAAAAGLPLAKATRIEASVPGGELLAYEDTRLVRIGSRPNSHQVFTSVWGALRTSPPELFEASGQGALTTAPTFTTGDAEFDETVVVAAKDADAGREFLTPRRRKALLKFLAAVPDGGLFGNGIGYTRDGRMRSKELTRTILAVKNALAELDDVG
jgi:hypothetical protein